jgi:hypothetical protein
MIAVPLDGFDTEAYLEDYKRYKEMERIYQIFLAFFVL